MEIGRARAIFEQLDSDRFSDEEKVRAIRRVANMETHNSVRKMDCLKALRFLLSLEVGE